MVKVAVKWDDFLQFEANRLKNIVKCPEGKIRCIPLFHLEKCRECCQKWCEEQEKCLKNLV